VAIVVVLALVRSQYPYADHFTAAGFSAAGTTLSPPKGSSVSGSWATSNGGSVSFQILDSQGNVVYFSEGSTGDYTFTASSPPYAFEALSTSTVTVYVWGNYSYPLL
jgi:hypothetical protein